MKWLSYSDTSLQKFNQFLIPSNRNRWTPSWSGTACERPANSKSPMPSAFRMRSLSFDLRWIPCFHSCSYSTNRLGSHYRLQKLCIQQFHKVSKNRLRSRPFGRGCSIRVSAWYANRATSNRYHQFVDWGLLRSSFESLDYLLSHSENFQDLHLFCYRVGGLTVIAFWLFLSSLSMGPNYWKWAYGLKGRDHL